MAGDLHGHTGNNFQYTNDVQGRTSQSRVSLRRWPEQFDTQNVADIEPVQYPLCHTDKYDMK